jgi:hypothetical protein
MNCPISKPLEFDGITSGLWEQIRNPGCKPLEFETFGKQAALNSFPPTPRKCIKAKPGTDGEPRISRRPRI